MSIENPPPSTKPAQPNLFGLLKPYRLLVLALLGLALCGNALNLTLPKLIARGIDSFSNGTFVLNTFVLTFTAIALCVFVFTYAQGVMQVYVSERVARDLRERFTSKLSQQTYAYVQSMTSSKLLTNLTSDIDAIKLFVSQAIVSIVSSVFLIIGASALLFSINAKLAAAVLVILPVIATMFYTIFSKVGVLFKASQQVIDRLNKIINESILGAALIRVLNAQQPEYEKFLAANTEAKDMGLKILRLFAGVIPIITFIASMATIIILAFGGRLVIGGEMSIGELAAFNAYLSILIFPIFIIGFMSNAIARASASYARVSEVLTTPDKHEGGTLQAPLRGDIEVKSLSLSYGEKPVLKNASFTIKAGTKTAIIGPTAAGKTQLLHLMTGLVAPTSGQISYDGQPLEDYEKTSFHAQVGLVFQDSIVFQTTLEENIAFNKNVSPENMHKAIATAELGEFIETLPEKAATRVSERGSSLSGGQKQRIMLARALALNPTVLFLDDFTARVDAQTEQRILKNLSEHYPHLTLISVTQKIASIKDYDQIILLMEGEVLATGTHAELMQTSPEYVQIADSQRTTTQYDTHAA